MTYVHEYGMDEKLDDDSEPLSPRWSISLGTGQGTLTQIFSAIILGRRVEREVELEQLENWLSLSWIPNSNWSLSLTGNSFTYSRSKSDLRRAFQIRFLNLYSSNVASSLSRVPESSGSASLNYIWNDHWSTRLVYSETKLVVVSSTIQRAGVSITRAWDLWEVTLGASTLQDETQEEMFSLQLGRNWF